MPFPVTFFAFSFFFSFSFFQPPLLFTFFSRIPQSQKEPKPLPPLHHSLARHRPAVHVYTYKFAKLYTFLHLLTTRLMSVIPFHFFVYLQIKKRLENILPRIYIFYYYFIFIYTFLFRHFLRITQFFFLNLYFYKYLYLIKSRFHSSQKQPFLIFIFSLFTFLSIFVS